MKIWIELAISLAMLGMVSCGNPPEQNSNFTSDSSSGSDAAGIEHTRSVLIANSGSRDWQQVVNKVDQIAISPVDKITNLHPLVELKRLQILDLANNGFTAEQLAPVAKIRSLQIVVIEGNQLTQGFIDALAQLSSMHLIFHGGSFSCPARSNLKCVGSTDLNPL